VTPELSSHANR